MSKSVVEETIKRARDHLELEREEHEASVARLSIAIDALEKVLSDEPAQNDDQPQKRKYVGRAPNGQNRERVLELLRRNPTTAFSSWEIAAELDLPSSSAFHAAKNLVKTGLVEKVDVTSRGGPIIRYLAHYRPGEEVSA